jgi:hypothetical protein
VTLHCVRPAYEDVEEFCRRCGKKLCVDLGGNYFGEVTGPVFCPNCGVQPEARDWAAGLRAAIAAVKALRETA